MTREFRYVLPFVLVLSPAVICAQAGDTEPRAQFQVASVKANKTADPAMRLDTQGSRFLAINIPLKQLIRAAYTLQLYQIVNAPSWVDSERFDVSATADMDLAVTAPWTPGGNFAPLQLMLQTLLADRFKMTTHYEMRPSQVYALVFDKPAAASTSRLATADADCAPSCGMRLGPGTLAARNVPLPQLAELLSQITGRVVIDGTGLGNFDFDLEWSPEARTGPTDAPSIFTAVQEQLGLKLDRGTAPVQHLVIDHIERPDSD